MRIVCFGLLAAACFAASVGPVLAQVTPEERRACGPDAMRLCREFVPDQTKVEACLTAKQAELSEACRAVMAGTQKAAPTAPKQATANPTVKKKKETKAKPAGKKAKAAGKGKAAKEVVTTKKRSLDKPVTHERKKGKKTRAGVSVKG